MKVEGELTYASLLLDRREELQVMPSYPLAVAGVRSVDWHVEAELADHAQGILAVVEEGLAAETTRQNGVELILLVEDFSGLVVDGAIDVEELKLWCWLLEALAAIAGACLGQTIGHNPTKRSVGRP